MIKLSLVGVFILLSFALMKLQFLQKKKTKTLVRGSINENNLPNLLFYSVILSDIKIHEWLIVHDFHKYKKNNDQWLGINQFVGKYARSMMMKMMHDFTFS